MKCKPASLTAYVSRIEELADGADPSPLLAHSYVRYLGDLSGGQIIRHVVAKAYTLDEKEGRGVSFYAFKSLRSQKLANQGEMKRIKEWFRDGIDAAGNLSANVKGENRTVGFPNSADFHWHSISRGRGEQSI
jgi:heme oxygenase (biliverdin-producing, ferredoxin)